jgi:hypothetical protein
MSEDGITDAGQADGGNADAGSAQPTSFIGDDGAFQEGWKDAYLTDDIKTEKVFDRVKTIQGAMKSLASAERMIGADKIAKPSDKYSEDDWNAFYDAGGRPADAEQYALKQPEGLPEGMWSDERAKGYKELFHKIGLSAKQVEAISDYYGSDLGQQLQAGQTAQEQAQEELHNGLLSDWGNAFEQKKHLGNLAIEKGVDGNEEFKARIVEKFGSDPDFIRFASNIGSQFNESSSISGVKVAPTPADLDNKIAEVMQSDAFNNPRNPAHRQAVENLTRLHKQKAGQP